MEKSKDVASLQTSGPAGPRKDLQEGWGGFGGAGVPLRSVKSGRHLLDNCSVTIFIEKYLEKQIKT